MCKQYIQDGTNCEGPKDTDWHSRFRIFGLLCCCAHCVKPDEGKENNTSCTKYTHDATIIMTNSLVIFIRIRCGNIGSMVFGVDKAPAQDNDHDHDRNLGDYNNTI